MAHSTCLVTGASGFLGLHLTQVLTAGGHTVRSLGRRRSALLDRLDVQQVEGSVTDPQAVRRALEGVQAVYHLAGAVSREKEGGGALYEVHIKGTRAVLQGCVDQGIDQVLVLSTSGTVGVGRQPSFVATEDSPVAWDLIKAWPYYESKAFGEREIARFVADGLPVKVARPTLLLGPGDHNGSSTGDVVRFLSGKVTAALPGGLSLVDVRDVAAVLPRLLTDGTPGTGYLLSAGNLSIREFLVLLEQVSGVRAPAFTLPRKLTDRAGGLLARLSALESFGGLARQTFEMGCHYWYLDSSRAERELGFQARPLSETLRETVDYLRATGLVAR